MKDKPYPESCMYCQTPNGFYEVYYVRKATKPKGQPYRWKNIGYCCERCHEVDKKSIEYDEFAEKKVS